MVTSTVVVDSIRHLRDLKRGSFPNEWCHERPLQEGASGSRGAPANATMQTDISGPKLQSSRSGVGMLGEVGVKIPITAPNAIATATASAIRMNNAARITAATVRKDSGLSCSVWY